MRCDGVKSHLNVNDSLGPDGHLQYHPHRRVELHWAEQHHVVVLQQGMGVELVQEVHDGVGVQRRRADDHVLLALGPVGRVAAAQLLPFHPREGKLFELLTRERGEKRKGNCAL